MSIRTRAVNVLVALVTALAATVLGVGGVAHATTARNDYPYAGSGVDQVDRWNFYTRECTSFVAWRINNDAHVNFTNQYGGVTWGNASNWANAARQSGVPVDTRPAVGSVAQFPPNVDGAGSAGHVAWVIGVGNGTVTVEDYNYAGPWNGNASYTYGQHTVATAGLNFIHFGGAVGTPGGPETWINPATNKYMDLDHSRAGNGTKIQIWTGDNTDAQWWIRQSNGDGYWRLTNKGTGKCVGVSASRTDDGAPVVEWDCNGRTDQLWTWESKGRMVNGWPVWQIRNRNSGKCLDITGRGTTDGTPLQQWGCGGGANQEWY
ncbi:RICIN domain-containing protein [Micromonospora sp. 067-2]|uniref:RICIN domain-containing protein n=1 Tax=Micromonospora sp. 067-2 TaxID=2789270 RepID=UPI00397AE923